MGGCLTVTWVCHGVAMSCTDSIGIGCSVQHIHKIIPVCLDSCTIGSGRWIGSGDTLAGDARVENVLLTVRDGVQLVVKA